MFNRLRTGTTAENNQQVLEAGELTLDVEAKALRVHNGESLGGLELVGQRAYEPPPGVGPAVLIAGDSEVGYYGEVAPGEFFTAGDLKTAVGLSSGRVYRSDPGWFKFSYQGRPLWTPKQALVYNIDWQDLYQAGLVYGVDGEGPFPYPSNQPVNQLKVVEFGGVQYKVRLMTGADTDPATAAGGEYSALMLRVVSSGGYSGDDQWETYSAESLDLYSSTANSIICQESNTANTQAVIRGGSGSASWYGLRDKHEGRYAQYRSWRPVLELAT